jgi:hypothetical protein
MFNDEETELTDAERAAFAALPTERAPSDLLEGRVVSELRSRGILSPATRRRRRVATYALRGAAAVFLFAAGVFTERFVLNRSAREGAAPIVEGRTAAKSDGPGQLSNEPAKPAQLELWI